MRKTDEDERPKVSAPHKIPGALTPPVPWDGNPAPEAAIRDQDSEMQTKPATPVTVGFASFEG